MDVCGKTVVPPTAPLFFFASAVAEARRIFSSLATLLLCFEADNCNDRSCHCRRMFFFVVVDDFTDQLKNETRIFRPPV